LGDKHSFVFFKSGGRSCRLTSKSLLDIYDVPKACREYGFINGVGDNYDGTLSLLVGYDDGSADPPMISLTTGSVITSTDWVQAAATYDGSETADGAAIYVNGSGSFNYNVFNPSKTVRYKLDSTSSCPVGSYVKTISSLSTGSFSVTLMVDGFDAPLPC
jgi:hypothetical protein